MAGEFLEAQMANKGALMLDLTSTQDHTNQSNNGILFHPSNQQKTTPRAGGSAQKRLQSSHTVGIRMSYEKAEAIQSGVTTTNY